MNKQKKERKNKEKNSNLMRDNLWDLVELINFFTGRGGEQVLLYPIAQNLQFLLNTSSPSSNHSNIVNSPYPWKSQVYNYPLLDMKVILICLLCDATVAGAELKG